MSKERKIILIGKSLVIDNEKVLMVRRHKPHQPSAHDKWELPGGKVEFGEHPKKTCERECLEETGYKVKSIKLIDDIFTFTWNHPDRESFVVAICYLAKLIGGESSDQDKEVSEVKWFPTNKVPAKEECIPGTVEFIERFQEKTSK
jgi:ADP-ribose pyrophosphatase YjhB (NUDIX family)